MALLLVAAACTKNPNEALKTDKPVLQTHGRGAILDRAAFLKAPKVNVAEVVASLKANGVSPKFELVVAGKQVETISPDLTPPSSVVLLHPTAGDQGATNTCVSWALGYAAKQIMDLTWQSSTADAGQRSGWYIYNKIYSTSSYGYGCSVGDVPSYGGYGLNSIDGLNCVKNSGVASATAQPSYAACTPATTTTANNSAATDKSASYAAVTNINDAKQLLAAGLPVYFAFRFYNDFETAFNNGTTWSTLNSTGTGGHAVCLIGYDDTKSAFLVQNSWGTYGGDATYHGCVWVSYSVLYTLLAQGYAAGGGEAYIMQPFSTTATHLYYNTAQSRDFAPSCSVGVGSGVVTYSVAANKYSSPVSVAAANAYAQNEINQNGQTYANSHGTCTPTNITVTLSKGAFVSGTYAIQFSGAPGTFQKPFNNGTVTVPAGIYQVGIFPVGGSSATHSYSGSTCTMSYNGSGTSATFNNVLMNCGGGATFSIN
ncbi:MAG TPA: DUF5977 domain-containing protein [Mucilaginibacter sp.]|nr:DUF5977 domain-containing protein [Mucilaginibacter sp.]